MIEVSSRRNTDCFIETTRRTFNDNQAGYDYYFDILDARTTLRDDSIISLRILKDGHLLSLIEWDGVDVSIL